MALHEELLKRLRGLAQKHQATGNGAPRSLGEVLRDLARIERGTVQNLPQGSMQALFIEGHANGWDELALRADRQSAPLRRWISHRPSRERR